jgi:tRNA(Ile)-lysidine synthase
MNSPAIESAFAAACDRLAPMRSGAALMLGCSAGGDSMALLELVAGAAPSRGWRVAVAHFDHAQRPESAQEATFVAQRCAALGVGFITGRLEATETDAAPLSEERLRRARFEFFARAASQTMSDALVLAHQADDRAETLVMRLLSGAGPTGLASIRPIEQIEGLTVVRPLLGMRRAELREFLKSRGVAFIDDPTNEDERRKRVWVRRRAMPFFAERMGRDVTPHLVRAAELIEEESSALTEACEALLLQIVSPAGKEESASGGIMNRDDFESLDLDSPIWRGASPGLRRRLLRQWLWRLRRSPHPPGFEAVAEALRFAEVGAQGARLRTIERIHLLKEGGRLIAQPPENPGVR